MNRLATCCALALPLLFQAAVPALAASSTNVSPAMAADPLPYPQDDARLPGKGPAQKWADFPRIWSERHAEWRQRGNLDRGAVVFLGDSITQGWTSLGQTFPGLKAANRGIGGDTTRGVWYRLKTDVLALNPRAIVLLIGTNDIGIGADPADVADNIKEILAAIRAFNPDLPVILCEVMPRGDQGPGAAMRIKDLNTRLESLANGSSHIALCDSWSPFADAGGTCKREEFPDLLHPNAVGYAKFGAALKPVLTQFNLLAKPAE